MKKLPLNSIISVYRNIRHRYACAVSRRVVHNHTHQKTGFRVEIKHEVREHTLQVLAHRFQLRHPDLTEVRECGAKHPAVSEAFA